MRRCFVLGAVILGAFCGGLLVGLVLAEPGTEHIAPQELGHVQAPSNDLPPRLRGAPTSQAGLDAADAGEKASADAVTAEQASVSSADPVTSQGQAPDPPSSLRWDLTPPLPKHRDSPYTKAPAPLLDAKPDGTITHNWGRRGARLAPDAYERMWPPERVKLDRMRQKWTRAYTLGLLWHLDGEFRSSVAKAQRDLAACAAERMPQWEETIRRLAECEESRFLVLGDPYLTPKEKGTELQRVKEHHRDVFLQFSSPDLYSRWVRGRYWSP